MRAQWVDGFPSPSSTGNIKLPLSVNECVRVCTVPCDELESRVHGIHRDPEKDRTITEDEWLNKDQSS